MIRCTARATLQAGGRPITEVRCELEAGHAVARNLTRRRADGGGELVDRISATAHRFTLTWLEPGAPIDDDSDPGVEVPLDE